MATYGQYKNLRLAQAAENLNPNISEMIGTPTMIFTSGNSAFSPTKPPIIGGFRPLSTKQINFLLEKQIIFNIEQVQCPPNAMCPAVVRYSYIGTKALVPSDEMIVSRLDAPSLYATKGTKSVLESYLSGKGELQEPKPTEPKPSQRISDTQPKDKTLLYTALAIGVGVMVYAIYKGKI